MPTLSHPDAMTMIAALYDGREVNADTHAQVIEVLRAAGFTIREPIGDCPTCHGYGTGDGQPARDGDRRQRYCRACGGTGENADALTADVTRWGAFRDLLAVSRQERAESGQAAFDVDGQACPPLYDVFRRAMDNLDAEDAQDAERA